MSEDMEYDDGEAEELDQSHSGSELGKGKDHRDEEEEYEEEEYEEEEYEEGDEEEGDEEDDEEEDDEEEDDEEGDSEEDEEVESEDAESLSSGASYKEASSTRKRKRRRVSNNGDETLLQRAERLQAENDELRRTVTQLRSQLAVHSTTSRPQIESAAPPPPSGPGPMLKLLVQGNNDSDLHQVHPPHRFSRVGAFPHAVVLNEGQRQYQVEARRPSTLVYGLVNDDGTPATGKDIVTEDMLFKLSIHYADTDREVSPNDFSKGRTVDSLVSPSTALTGLKRLVNGSLSLRVNFLFYSVNTLGTKNRPVIVRLQPADPQLRTNPRLKVDSFPFMVRGKVTASRP